MLSRFFCLALVLAPVSALAEDGLGALRAVETAARAGTVSMRLLAAAAPPFPGASEDACAKGVAGPVTPTRGKNGVIWAQAAACLPFSFAAVAKAAMDTGVMTFEGVTRFNGVSALSTEDAVRRLRIDYESRKRYLGMCHTAHWPKEWTYRVTKGAASAPEEAVIEFTRVAGGDFNGSYIKVWRGRIELRDSGTGKVAVAMRYEIDAPTQSPDSAAGAVLAYLDRLAKKASGKALPGPVANPDCPE